MKTPELGKQYIFTKSGNPVTVITAPELVIINPKTKVWCVEVERVDTKKKMICPLGSLLPT